MRRHRLLVLLMILMTLSSTAFAFSKRNKRSFPLSSNLIISGGGGSTATTATKSSPTPLPTPSPFGPNAAPPGFLRTRFPRFPWHRLPNFLTYLRCLAIPLVILTFYHNLPSLTSLLFALASFTDWLDGFLARRWDIASPFGAFLDPVADKLLVAASLVLLAGKFGTPIAIPATVILAREIAVSALREWMAQRNQRDAVQVGWQGKVKTAATMLALTVLLMVSDPTRDKNLYLPGLAMLYLSMVVTVTSGSAYFRAAAPVLLGKV